MENPNKHIDPIGLLPKYFAREANPEEIIEIENWIALNSNNKKEFDAFSKLWNASGPVSGLPDINLDLEWEKLESTIAPNKAKTFSLTRILQIAATIVLISTLAFIGIKFSSTITEKSAVAELKTISLPDGTIVSLNAGSKIDYNKGFGTKHRNINLKGEAYFEVEKNRNLPFVISANEATIEVIGTKFNVKAYKNIQEVKVLVTEGTVSLFQTSRPANKTILVAGETGSFNKILKDVQKTTAGNLNDIAWRTLNIDFNNTSLMEAASILENTYHVPIEVDPIVQNCLITVHFEKQDLVSTLRVLKSTLDLKINTDNNLIKITGTGC